MRYGDSNISLRAISYLVSPTGPHLTPAPARERLRLLWFAPSHGQRLETRQ
jgi:hypothetical protein